MSRSTQIAIFLLTGSIATATTPAPVLTAPPSGPYHTSGNRILDSRGRPYLMRGTTMPTLTLNQSDLTGEGIQFGPYSPSSFITLRQRMNMNAIRVPLDTALYDSSAEYRSRAKHVVEEANQFELLVVLSSSQAGTPEFWSKCGRDFSSNQDVFFEVPNRSAFDAIRSAGADQPIVVPLEQPAASAPNLVYEIISHYATRSQDSAVWDDALALNVPLVAIGMDPDLDRASAECAAFPSDPAQATNLLEAKLKYFDEHNVSWLLSSFTPGKTITEYRFYNWSKLDDGWTCGESPSKSGIAMVLQGHLWSRNPHALFPVNQTTGSFVLPRGGISTAYGPILADREIVARSNPLPVKLGNVSIHITDSRGVEHLAPLIYTGAGWSEITFVVPASLPTGPADVAVVRTDGSRSSGKVLITDFAPGFWSASMDGRGAAIGLVTQLSSNGAKKEFQASDCATYGCRPVAIPLSPLVHTTIRLEASGFRYAGEHPEIRATIAGIRVPVVALTPGEVQGHERLTLKLPKELRGRGESDLIVTVNGVLANVVRINCGS